MFLYFRYVKHSILSQMQYRTSFVFQSIGHFIITGIEFLGIWALFARFGSLRGYSLTEVALFYGTINTAFAFADALGRGFDVLSTQIKSGEFDRILLRPRSTILQIFGYEFTMRRIGRFAQGVAVLTYATISLGLHRDPLALILITMSIFGSVLLFLGLYVIQATISFWTIESLEIMNTVTYGGVETAQYPMSIYRTMFRRFFTFVVPLACVTYFPLRDAIDPSGFSLIGMLAPWVGPIFFGLTMGIWKLGLRHYTSTGS